MKAHDLVKEANEDLFCYQVMRNEKKTEREIADDFSFKTISELRKHIALCRLIIFEGYKSKVKLLSAHGLNNAQIAKELKLSEVHVRTIRANINKGNKESK